MFLHTAVGSCGEGSSVFCYIGCFVVQYVMIWHLWKYKVPSTGQGGDSGGKKCLHHFSGDGRILLKLFVQKWVE